MPGTPGEASNTGATGPTGIDGRSFTGPTGATGPQGEDGADWQDGEDGEDGEAVQQAPLVPREIEACPENQERPELQDSPSPLFQAFREKRVILGRQVPMECSPQNKQPLLLLLPRRLLLQLLLQPLQ